jgi:hypothetical protein
MANINFTDDSYRSESGGGRIRETAIYVGIVKGNSDPQRMGRLAVYIPELGGGGDPDDPQSWYTVSYASPFAGATNLDNNEPGGKEMYQTQTSYGFWMVPPDLNNEVLVCFANGDTQRGFWFGCLYQQFMNHMVPAMGINRSTNDEINSENLPPVCEYNRMDDEQDIWDPKRPVFEPLHNGLSEQGLYTDPERGPATTGARRESPSKVFGFSTPRGNNIHIDDDEENEFIRLRTRSGVQILIHETTGYIYMISKKGHSWFELSDEGIDMYTKRSISMRAEENINLHADGSIVNHGVGAIHSRSGNMPVRSETDTMIVSDNRHSTVSTTNTTDAQQVARSSEQIVDGAGPSLDLTQAPKTPSGVGDTSPGI